MMVPAMATAHVPMRVVKQGPCCLQADDVAHGPQRVAGLHDVFRDPRHVVLHGRTAHVHEIPVISLCLCQVLPQALFEVRLEVEVVLQNQGCRDVPLHHVVPNGEMAQEATHLAASKKLLGSLAGLTRGVGHVVVAKARVVAGKDADTQDVQVTLVQDAISVHGVHQRRAPRQLSVRKNIITFR